MDALDPSHPDHRSTIEKIVENNVFKLIFRFGLPTLVTVVGYLLLSQFSDIKATITTTSSDIGQIKLSSQKIADTVDHNTKTLSDLNATMNSRFDAQSKRMDIQDKRTDKIDDRLRNVEIRIYQGAPP